MIGNLIIFKETTKIIKGLSIVWFSILRTDAKKQNTTCFLFYVPKQQYVNRVNFGFLIFLLTKTEILIWILFSYFNWIAKTKIFIFDAAKQKRKSDSIFCFSFYCVERQKKTKTKHCKCSLSCKFPHGDILGFAFVASTGCCCQFWVVCLSLVCWNNFVK